ncbi:hypothetical protein AQJ46_03740 [Streptomyces canus]|uniref:Uncharacterized protein n=1 Tax=Streptomyces canus TaxID=58343 RepID=A0A101SHZ1_9ACTN|nr:hypothetical protein AQJ46_03740 [Streptomyces canus]
MSAWRATSSSERVSSTAAGSASRVGKCRYRVPGPTPASLATTPVFHAPHGHGSVRPVTGTPERREISPASSRTSLYVVLNLHTASWRVPRDVNATFGVAGHHVLLPFV